MIESLTFQSLIMLGIDRTTFLLLLQLVFQGLYLGLKGCLIGVKARASITEGAKLGWHVGKFTMPSHVFPCYQLCTLQLSIWPMAIQDLRGAALGQLIVHCWNSYFQIC